VPVYADSPAEQPPAPAPSAPEPETSSEAAAFFDALATIDVPPPDIGALVKAYSASRPKVSIGDMRAIALTLQALVAQLTDATPTEAPPAGWRH
jgi:hypothetical protein